MNKIQIKQLKNGLILDASSFNNETINYMNNHNQKIISDIFADYSGKYFTMKDYVHYKKIYVEIIKKDNHYFQLQNIKIVTDRWEDCEYNIDFCFNEQWINYFSGTKEAIKKDTNKHFKIDLIEGDE